MSFGMSISSSFRIEGRAMRAFLVIFSAFCFCCSSGHDYYWRDYNGTVPVDAYVAGYDNTKQFTYIGQVFIAGHGLQVVRIQARTRYVRATHKGVILKTREYIKIMCAPNRILFNWIPVNAKELHLSLINVPHAVVGGVEDGHLLNIGRAIYSGEQVMGKVASYKIGAAKLYFYHNNTEKTLDEYAILTNVF